MASTTVKDIICCIAIKVISPISANLYQLLDRLDIPRSTVSENDSINLITVGGITFKVVFNRQFVVTALNAQDEPVLQTGQANIGR